MECPFCSRALQKSMWRPCQWPKSMVSCHVYEGCKECDALSVASQMYLCDGIAWRFWYIRQPAEARALEAMVEGTRQHPERAAWHNHYMGEKMTAILMELLVLACHGWHITNSRTSADLLEAALRRHRDVRLVKDLLKLMALLLWLKVSRTSQPKGPRQLGLPLPNYNGN